MKFDKATETLFQLQRIMMTQQRESMLTALHMAFLIPRLTVAMIAAHKPSNI